MNLENINRRKRNRYRAAQNTARRLIAILKRRYRVRKVVLVGSLNEKDRFGRHSDIDLCVEGIPPKKYFQVVGELLLEADEFDVDLVPIETATQRMMQSISAGKILYEKK
jgi:predicted nucleotidyltransferase